jgi:hypothetical protein
MFSRAFPAPTSFLLLSAALLSTGLVTGCGMGVTGSGTAPSVALQGHIMGGQQPVTGSTIQLYAANGTSYGAASTPLLTSTVTSGAGGSFTISNLYTCPSATTQVYLVASGGNPGLPGTVNNTALTLMAALGNCGNLTSSTNIIINEVTTVAAVWALAPFMKAYDHIGATTENAVGLSNAFGMAANLANFGSGSTPGNAPTGSTIPSAELNTLANVLASCVNTDGTGSACSSLFTLATPTTSGGPGGVITAGQPSPEAGAGTAPTNTADAALDIALNPGNNVADIYALADPLGPFQTGLGTAPNDWTVAVNFSIGNRSTSSIAFDATGNLWVEAPDALYQLSPQGAGLGSFSAMAGNTVAIDATGNIWVSTATNTLAKMPSTLATPVVYPAPNVPNKGVDGLAIDGLGDPWYTCDSCSAVYKLDPSGNPLVTVPVTSTISTNISVDPSENIWLGNFSYAKVNVLQNNGTPVTNSPLGCGTCGTPGFVANDGGGNAWIIGNDLTRLAPGGAFTNYESPAGGLFSPAAVAIDGAGNAWVANTVESTGANAGSLSEFSNTGTALSPALGYVSSTLATPLSIAIDGSGNIWLRNSGNSSVTAFVGAGVPVVTPLALGVKNGTLGSKP